MPNGAPLRVDGGPLYAVLQAEDEPSIGEGKGKTPAIESLMGRPKSESTGFVSRLSGGDSAGREEISHLGLPNEVSHLGLRGEGWNQNKKTPDFRAKPSVLGAQLNETMQ